MTQECRRKFVVNSTKTCISPGRVVHRRIVDVLQHVRPEFRSRPVQERRRGHPFMMPLFSHVPSTPSAPIPDVSKHETMPPSGVAPIRLVESFWEESGQPELWRVESQVSEPGERAGCGRRRSPRDHRRASYFHSLSTCGSDHFMRMELPRTTAARSQQRCSNGIGLHTPLPSLYPLPDEARTGLSTRLTCFDF